MGETGTLDVNSSARLFVEVNSELVEILEAQCPTKLGLVYEPFKETQRITFHVKLKKSVENKSYLTSDCTVYVFENLGVGNEIMTELKIDFLELFKGKLSTLLSYFFQYEIVKPNLAEIKEKLDTTGCFFY